MQRFTTSFLYSCFSFCIVLLLAASAAWAQQTFYVRTDGNDANNGSANTPAGAFRTLAAAIAAAQNNGQNSDIINLVDNAGGGTMYTVGATLSSADVGLMIRSRNNADNGPGDVTLSLNGDFTMLSLQGNNQQILDLKFAAPASLRTNLLELRAGENQTVRNCAFEIPEKLLDSNAHPSSPMRNWSGNAIYLFNAQNAVISQNTIRNFRQGIRLEPNVTANLIDNNIYYCKGGIIQFGQVAPVKTLNIRNNRFWEAANPEKRNEWDIVFADFQSFALFQTLYTSIAAVRDNNAAPGYIPAVLVRPFPIQEQITNNRSVIYVDNSNPAFAAYTLSNNSLNGKDSLGNFYQPFSSLADAVHSVITGGYIYIKPGIYDQSVIIDKPLTIEVQGDGIPAITSLTQNIAGSGILTLIGSLEIRRQLNLQSGHINPGNGRVIVGNPNCNPLPQITGGSANSFIISNGIGGLQRMCLGAGGITSAATFPLGSNVSSYTPLSLRNIGARDTFSLSLREQVLTDGLSGAAFTEQVVNRTWVLEEANPGGTDATLQAQWNAAEELNFLRGSCLLAVHNGGFWQPLTNFGLATAPAPFTRSASGVRNLGAIAVRSSFNCPAPTLLQTVNGSVTFTSAAVQWSPTTLPVEIQIQAEGGAWSAPVITSASPYTFNGLQPGVTYTARIRAVCLENQIYSEYLSVTFTTESCPAPNNLTLSNLSFNSVEGSFSPVLNAITYEVEYRITGNPSSRFFTPTPNFSLANLSQGAEYEVCVRSICVEGAIFSAKVCTTFITPNCQATELIRIQNINFTSAEVAWSPVAGADGYELEYRIAGGNWIPVAGLSPVTLSPLQAPANYEVRIRTRCGNAFSDYKSTFFQTPSCRPALNFSATKISFTEAEVNWVTVVNAVGYEIRWRRFGAINWENQISTTTPPVAITGLTPNADYEIQIRTICVENTIFSDWLSTGFKTLECLAPQNITVRNITYSTAEVSWSAAQGVTLYEISYQIEGSGAWSAPETLSATAIILQGLTQGREYRVRVRSICTPGVLEAENSVLFSTVLCPPIQNLAFNNVSFTSFTLTWQAAPQSLGYEVYYKEADSVNWKGPIQVPSNRCALTGLRAGVKYYVRVRSICIADIIFSDSVLDSVFTNTACNNKPVVRIENIGYSSGTVAWEPIPNITRYEISFKFFGQTDPEWYTLLTNQNPYVISGLRPNTDYWVRVRGVCLLDTVYTEYGAWTFRTKDCPEPTGVTVSLVTPYEATLSWATRPQAIRYQVNYREIGTTRWKVETVAAGSLTLKNLYPNQCYEAQARSECSAGSFSNYSSFVQFCTGEGCSPPKNITVSGQANSALAQWELPQGSAGTIVFWARNILPLNWQKAVVPAPTNQYRIENLAGNENYLLSLLTQCGNENSPWSEVINFVTIGVSREKTQESVFSIYPNPTRGGVEIVTSADLPQTPILVEVLELGGRRLYTENRLLIENKLHIDLENLPNGIYFISLTQNQSNFRQKIIKY